MVKGEDGLPILGSNTKSLGVRIPGVTVDADAMHFDTVLNEQGQVEPDNGGMSVNPPEPEDTVQGLSRRRLGEEKTVLWRIDVEVLSKYSLKFRLDPKNPDHGFIEPLETCDGSDYNENVQATQSDWEEYDASDFV